MQPQHRSPWPERATIALIAALASASAQAENASSGAFVTSGAAGSTVAEFTDTPVSNAPTPAASPSGGGQPASVPKDDFVEQPVGSAGAAPASAPAAPSTDPFAFLKNVQRDTAFFGDMWGFRPFLAKFGTTLTIQEQSEILGNLTGGTQRTAVYEGLTTATLQTDTQRAFGWTGGLFNASLLQIHGGNLSTQALDSLQTASGIEADRATRLWELWYQQKFGDSFDIKVGQQSLDQEFMVTQNGSYFVNTMFGWPMLPSADMPGGGPAYPLSDLGIRGRVHFGDQYTLLVGVFNGAPMRSDVGDPQRADPNGVSFPLGQGALAIAELQYVYPGPNTLVKAGEADPLSRTYKIGVWYDSDRFNDLNVDSAGQSLANPNTTGLPRTHDGDYAFYGVVDQMIYRFPDEADRNINVFLRPMYTPLEDRNLIDFSLNAGVTMHEPILGRDDDTAGIGMGYTHVSASASAYDKAYASYNPGQFWPTRSGETFVEAFYQYQPLAWLQVQPDVQYTFNPGGGLVNPNDPTKKIGDELVAGVRVNAQF